MRLSRAIGNLRLSVKDFIPLGLVSSSLPVLGLGLLVVPDYCLIAYFRFAREGAFGPRGKDSCGADGARGGYRVGGTK